MSQLNVDHEVGSHATVNGLALPLEPEPRMNVLDWLRQQGLTGAKEGCAEGECGACSILIARPGTASTTEWVAINSCLMPAAGLAGEEVLTAEGLGTISQPHEVQYHMAVRGGSQCGYCTPGFICSLAAEYYRADRGDHIDSHALSGNLCRCTGYRPIDEAARALAHPNDRDPIKARCNNPPPTPASIAASNFVRPENLEDALTIIKDNPQARLVAGSTDVGVELNIRNINPNQLVAIGHLKELQELTVGDDVVVIGAAVTLTNAESLLRDTVPLLRQLFPQFASRLIRNAATVGGNIATASPIGDLAPALLALNAELELISLYRRRIVPLTEYFTGYRRTVLGSGEMIRAVRIPAARPQTRCPISRTVTGFHKIAKRRFDDISSVAIASVIEVEDQVVTRACIGLGGVAATPIRAYNAEAALVGRPWSEATAIAAGDALAAEGTPMDDHRASAAYRKAMLRRSLHRLYAEHEARA